MDPWSIDASEACSINSRARGRYHQDNTEEAIGNEMKIIESEDRIESSHFDTIIKEIKEKDAYTDIINTPRKEKRDSSYSSWQ